jgi:hypothetical protein
MVFVTITESPIRTGGTAVASLVPNSSARRTTTGRSRARTVTVAVTPGVVLGVLVLLGAQVTGAVEALRAVTDAPVVMLAPLVSAAVALARLRMPMPGPSIHDRQLDLIVGLGAGLTACALVACQLSGSGRELGLLALAPTAVGVLAVVVGTRMLWHLRAVPALLALAWPAPWTALSAHFGAGSPARLAVLLGVGVIAVAVARVGGPLVVTRPTPRRALTPLAAQP